MRTGFDVVGWVWNGDKLGGLPDIGETSKYQYMVKKSSWVERGFGRERGREGGGEGGEGERERGERVRIIVAQILSVPGEGLVLRN
jgi:hypothetical protein